MSKTKFDFESVYLAAETKVSNSNAICSECHTTILHDTISQFI